jgi:PAS domain S-box-containing protein
VLMQIYNPRQQAYRQILISAVPLFREGEEKPYQVYTVFDDVTERKQTEENLRESEERYRGLFNQMTEGFALHEIICDNLGQPRDYRFLEINPAFEALTGLHRENVVGRQMSQVLPDEDPLWVDIYGKVALTGEPIHFENYSPVLNKHYEVFAYRPGLRQFATLFVDITERKEAEEALRDSEERYRKLVETSPAGIYVLQDGIYTFANPVGLGLLGLASQDELSKTPAIEFIAPEYRKTIRKRIKRADQGENNRPLEIELLAVDGSRRMVETRSVPIQVNGRSAVFIQSEDITARRQYEEEVRSSLIQIELQRRLLEQRERERQQIARDLHDGPVQELTGAAFALQGLMLDCADADTRQQIEAIRTSLQEQVSDLRGYAQELRPPALSKFGLEVAIRSHLDTFQEKHPSLKIDFVVADQDGGRLPEVVRVACYRIYQESLTNIVKHAQATQVGIRLSIIPAELKLEIWDNGTGFEIPKDWLELARHQHLGLVGIRERAEAIGGSVEIVSTKDAGTRIAVKIPLDRLAEGLQTG